MGTKTWFAVPFMIIPFIYLPVFKGGVLMFFINIRRFHQLIFFLLFHALLKFSPLILLDPLTGQQWLHLPDAPSFPAHPWKHPHIFLSSESVAHLPYEGHELEQQTLCLDQTIHSNERCCKVMLCKSVLWWVSKFGTEKFPHRKSRLILKCLFFVSFKCISR